jgi:hypothetical protein
MLGSIRKLTLLVTILTLASTSASWAADPAGTAKAGTRKYGDWERPQACMACHPTFFQQFRQSMMSQAYTHSWDEIEYFELAVPHAERNPKLAGIKADCNGCHAPMALLAGDIPPPRPGKSRADESVSCDFCHTISGRQQGPPHNFNWISSPGKTKYGPREGVESPHHNTKKLPLLSTAEFCGTCHNEKSPYGMWVKATQIEYDEGPYPKMGLKCHDCHMPKAKGRVAVQSKRDEEIHQHLFFGAHVMSKVRGAIEMRMAPDLHEVEPGDTVTISLWLFNAKAGHKIPTGSVEDRQLWVHLEAIDQKGQVYHLPVDRKGFDGEETTIASNKLAWLDLAEAQGLTNFKGLPRDGLPEGDRIFRMAYFNPKKQMTIMQWYTASFGPDYRIGPLETKVETYTFKVPENVPLGKIRIDAKLNYRLLVKPIGDFLRVPEEETRARLMNEVQTSFQVVDD